MMDQCGTKKCELFSPFSIRGVTLRNRIVVSPMCQYSSIDGHATSWHLVHLGSRAVGGAGMVVVEATAIEPRGRISPDDMGIWADSHIESLRPIAQFISENGAVPAIQLAHAGRKASTASPWKGRAPLSIAEGGWTVVGPSPLAFSNGYQIPEELGVDDISHTVDLFVDAARRAVDAGFQAIEIHAAHGYLLHSFLSPISNVREDIYGGSFENRSRFPLEVVRAVRAVIPSNFPVLVRISATDWLEGGWDLNSSVQLAKLLKLEGVDLVDCSSGMLVPEGRPDRETPGFQVEFANEIRNKAGIPTAAVGLISDALQAEEILANGRADLICIARASLSNPYWPYFSARQLGLDAKLPAQYERALPPPVLAAT